MLQISDFLVFSILPWVFVVFECLCLIFRPGYHHFLTNVLSVLMIFMKNLQKPLQKSMKMRRGTLFLTLSPEPGYYSLRSVNANSSSGSLKACQLP